MQAHTHTHSHTHMAQRKSKINRFHCGGGDVEEEPPVDAPLDSDLLCTSLIRFAYAIARLEPKNIPKNSPSVSAVRSALWTV